METSTSPSVDRWGEPVEQQAPRARRPSKRWWYLGGIVLLGAAALLGLRFGRQARVAALARSCERAAQAENWKEVQDLAVRWKWWSGARAEPLIFEAQAACKLGNYDQAVQALNHLPDDDPLTPNGLLDQSNILFNTLNRPIEGAEALERAVMLNPQFTEARRRLIYYYAFTLQRRKVIDHAYEAIQHDCDLPETYVYLMAQDWLTFANAYEQNTAWFQDNPDEELFLVARAINRIRTRGLDETADPSDGPATEEGVPYHEVIIGEYFQRFPQNLELLAYFLDEATTVGDVDRVATLLQQVPPEAVDDNRFWRFNGWLHAAHQELVEAQHCYEKALALNHYDLLSRHQLASVERRLRNMERVKVLEDLVRQGKALRQDLLKLERVDHVPPALLHRMAEYAAACGDTLAAGSLYARIEAWSAQWSAMQKQKE